MEMSIEKTIEFFNGLECHTPQAKDARDIAVDTMRKYQKIEEIMHKVYTSDNADVCLVQRLAEIRGVMEDGNIVRVVKH